MQGGWSGRLGVCVSYFSVAVCYSGDAAVGLG